jgi:hypothetical protein
MTGLPTRSTPPTPPTPISRGRRCGRSPDNSKRQNKLGALTEELFNPILPLYL